MQYLKVIRDHLHPQKVEDWQYHKAVDAIDKQLATRIARIAFYIFTTCLTIATITLTEVTPVTWPIAAPILLISLLAWGVFFYYSRADSAHVEGLVNAKRTDLATQELKRLIFLTPIAEWDTATSFNNLNKILGSQVFTPSLIDEVDHIKMKSCFNKTLWQVSQEKNISLKFKFSNEVFQRGLYGDEHKELHINAAWSGKENEDPVFSISEKTEKPLDLDILTKKPFDEHMSQSPSTS